MSYDGITLKAVSTEIDSLIAGARVEKIYQPSSLEIVLQLRSGREKHTLICSAHPQLYRVHIAVKNTIKNPDAPPSFCMLLRKHLQGSRLIKSSQNNLERVLCLEFTARDDFGGETKKLLFCELMGKHSNIILTTGEPEELLVLGSIKPVTEKMSRYRVVLPGHPYLPPPLQEKILPGCVTEENLAPALLQAGKAAPHRLLVSVIAGIGPEMAKELLFLCNGEDVEHPAEITRSLVIALQKLAGKIESSSFQPCIVRDVSGKFKFFLPFNSNRHPRTQMLFFPSMNEALETYYNHHIEKTRIIEQKNRLLQIVDNKLTKLHKKIAARQRELQEMQEADYHRACGEALLANLHRLKRGLSKISLTNYFIKPGPKTLTIKLDPSLTPEANAQRYFKKYRKLRDGKIVLERLLHQASTEASYLEKLKESLYKAADPESIQSVQAEIEDADLLPRQKKGPKKNQGKTFLHILSRDGTSIYVGRNSKQNEFLTFKKATASDTWMHVKNYSGAHVIIKSKNPSSRTLFEAAKLAVRYSNARHSANVPVDYTLAKNVRKPKGAKIGAVIYDNYRTVFVTPDDNNKC